ncbi:MAG: tRNA 2-thiouridine(34) synthase MnmA [Desulfobacterales bacterium]|nr:tRNA 2-thiouridine(34) synthase MnmA [Desulfobacterales bacterium]
MGKIIAVAMSGGIDSMMAAYFLKEQGHSVIGIHFVTGYEKENYEAELFNVAEKLKIPLKIVDISLDFKTKVIDYFKSTYESGKTPNPCLVCNDRVKFGTILNIVKDLGASHLATGHYARIVSDDIGRFHLLKGIDAAKDQSYFLAFLSQKQLSCAIFPLGDMTKLYVKELAKSLGLEAVLKEESQDVCFIKGKTYGEFLKEFAGFKTKQGYIKDTSGKILGIHNGLHLFTIGQRRGINCPAKLPYHVVSICPDENVLIVGFKEELFKSQCEIVDINWINECPNFPMKIDIRLRYRNKAAKAALFLKGDNSLIAEFEEPQSSITPGQGAVFYIGDEVIGAGWIR